MPGSLPISVVGGAITIGAGGWTGNVGAPLDLTGWTQAAASNYLCVLAGIDPRTQDGYVDSPPGAYEAINSTEPRLLPDGVTGARVLVLVTDTLAQAYSRVQTAPTA